MKGEYVEEENDINNNNTQNNAHNMFAKFSHHSKFQPPPPPHHHQHHFPPPHLHHSHHPFSEESDSATTTTTPTHHNQNLHESITKKPKIIAQTTTTTTSNEDGGTIEVSRRPRGRPPGSKNKPKPPVVITREPDPAMSPYILELPSGADVIDSLTRFTRRRGVGLCVLTASGAVANVTLKQPSTTTPGGTVTFHGRFDILSLSAVVVVNTVPFQGGGGGFTISLAGPQGQIVGGKVVGTLACSGTVYVIAASFTNPTYCRLPLDEQEMQPNSLCHGQGNEEENSAISGGGDGGGTMSLYSGNHLGNTPTTSATAAGDVIWATPTTTARPGY
ncbi:AT-hook motif nuclear-localized protein 28-like [Chenopodium quinoa]|uniref:AT-hook motif nuclear-localized protein 28-like n=1 Tax=Chenopodium quinoa TaxID=63459 RepID=UPI000B77D9C4|nr:AT-hook motif nuclear-localized protein 28-like [Chenopodium quinoa]